VPDFFPLGFKTTAVAAGIKKSGLDLGLIVSDRPATAAAVFTKNTFPAAPVLISRQNLQDSGHILRAVLVNSGNANACNGEEGLAVARTCVEQLAGRLGCSPSEVFVSSTGVIGRPLSADRICGALPGLISAGSDIGDFSRAIMTTDTFPKVASSEVGGVKVLGFAKGSGMIHPNMATMLSFVVTDAKVDFPDLDRALRYAVDRSFHSITVDGDTSTNDVVAVLANGASGITPKPEAFTAQLMDVCQQLAKSIARDGEGASKFVELTVEGAPSDDAAREIARCVARSPLVKTAIYGCDPNWGRLVAAVGNSGVPLSSDQVEIYIDDVSMIHGDLEAAQQRMRAKEIKFRIVLHSGKGRATVWTCDFTEGYIRINADYTT
jgi:glutamate N-acetyltransferase / amino-acid N-acetyltransferase